jgi:hypothetical protein
MSKPENDLDELDRVWEQTVAYLKAQGEDPQELLERAAESVEAWQSVDPVLIPYYEIIDEDEVMDGSGCYSLTFGPGNPAISSSTVTS